MHALGLALLVVAGLLFIAFLMSLYSTTMTARRSRISPAAIALGVVAVILGGIGGVLILL